MQPIKVLLANIDKPNSTSIDVYTDGGGYEEARKVVTSWTPDQVVQIVKDSELRGRGGAGFPTGNKWSFVPKNAPKPTYLLCNADESEPGTFKDRLLIEKDPHLLIEGMIIAAFAIGSNPMSYIYIRGEFHYGATVLNKALDEARAKGFLGKGVFGSNWDFDITVARGAGAYEFPMGITIKELIYDHCGGITADRKLKAVIPGGASAPMLLPDEIDLPLNFDALMKAGSMLGSAGIIVLDESVCIVDAVWRLAKFFAHESCGQCTPCREGTNWMESILDRLERGGGRQQDADLLLDMCDNVGGKSLCALGDAAIGPVMSSVRKFKSEYLHHVRQQSCLPGTRRYRRLDAPVATH